MRIQEALDRCVVQLRADGRSEHTQCQYRRMVCVLARWWPGEIEDIHHTDVARFLASDTVRLRPDGAPKKPTSLNAMRSVVRAFFSYCEAAGICSDNPARLVKRARCGDPPPRALSAKVVKRLEASLVDASARDRALVLVLLRAGLRIGEALGLDVEDVDLEAGELEIRRAKGMAPRVGYVDQETLRALTELVGERESGPLFLARGEDRLGSRQAQRRVVSLLRQAGARPGASAHSLRHTYALGLYERTGDIALVQAAMGHRSIASTTVYVSTDPNRLRCAMAWDTNAVEDH